MPELPEVEVGRIIARRVSAGRVITQVRCIDDPIVCRKLEDLGCAAVMPLAAPIGSGRGLKLRHSIEIMIEQAEVPVIIDAGLGAPSQAAESMELGADGVLVNTAIGLADD